MKDNVKLRSSLLQSMLFPRGGCVKKGFGQFLLVIVAGLVAVLVIWGPEVTTSISTENPNIVPVNYEFQANVERKNPVSTDEDNNNVEVVEETLSISEEEEEEKQAVIVSKQKGKKKKAVPGMNPRVKWETKSYSFQPIYSDWDAQRALNLKKNPPSRAPVGRQSRVMLVTSSTSIACNRSIGNHLLIKSIKNKLDYARIHDIQFYYNMAALDSSFDEDWGKLPVLRMLMVNHSDIDWFWWMDTDTWFTDMHFDVPFDKYTAEKKNLVIYGDDHTLYDLQDYMGINTGGILIRNCQWSLDFLDAWASMGLKNVREQAGKLLSQVLKDRPKHLAADDQSALAYLLIHEKKRWASSVALEMSFTLSGYWVLLTTKFEEMMENHYPGMGDSRWPLCVRFTGCQTCHNVSGYHSWDTCLQEMRRTFDFADNQVLRSHGFKVETLGSSELVPLNGWQTELKEGELYHMAPNVSDWDQQRLDYSKSSIDHRDHTRTRPRVLMVSGSGPKPCYRVEGTHFLLKALKNKIDYCRIHDMELFYNMGNMDKQLLGWWGKISVIRTMMLKHPEAEWIWWVDSDAVFTDMIFEPPFHTFEGNNLVLWGDEPSVYERKSFIGINAGDMIVRNCQWSLDLFDEIIPMGPDGPVRDEYGRMLSKTLTDRPQDMEADDQSALVYTFYNNKEKYIHKVRMENGFTLSGDWVRITKNYELMQAEQHPGLGNSLWPLVTHFAGCQPCARADWGNYQYDTCMREMGRSLNFADNQIVHPYGLEHQHLGTYELQKRGTTSAPEATTKSVHFQQKFH